MAKFIQALDASRPSLCFERAMRRTWLEHSGAMLCRFAAEHPEVEQRVGPQAVRTMHRDARRLADRHEAGHQTLAAHRPCHGFPLHIAGDAAHVVVDGREHRYRFLVDIYAGEYSGGFSDAGQSLFDNRGTQVLQMQIDMIFELTDAAPLANLNGH